MTLPASILTRDGRLVPFEPDRISRSLFAVTELMGTPNAFLARELTDGVLHFIGLEPDGPPTTSDLAEMVAKVVRELGYPAIARVYEENVKAALLQHIHDYSSRRARALEEFQPGAVLSARPGFGTPEWLAAFVRSRSSERNERDRIVAWPTAAGRSLGITGNHRRRSPGCRIVHRN
jgi:hypothetical protein